MTIPRRGGKFLKTLWCCVSRKYNKIICFINWVEKEGIGHRKEIRKLGESAKETKKLMLRSILLM